MWASGQAGVRLPQQLGTESAVRVVLAEVLPPFPPLEPAPTLLRGRGTSTSTLLHRQEIAALRAQGMGGLGHTAGEQGARLQPASPGTCVLHPRAARTAQPSS